MAFIVFALLIWSAGFFYRWEHRRLAVELAIVAEIWRDKQRLAEDADWRVVGQKDARYKDTGQRKARVMLKRRFHIEDSRAIVRYAMPVVLFCIILFGLQNWWLAFAYLAFAGIKWFACTVTLDAQDNSYEVALGDLRLFGDRLA